MIIRIIFAGSSALSRRSEKLAATMSRVREKMLIGRGSISEGGGRAGGRGASRRRGPPGRGGIRTSLSAGTRTISGTGGGDRRRRGEAGAGLDPPGGGARGGGA